MSLSELELGFLSFGGVFLSLSEIALGFLSLGGGLGVGVFLSLSELELELGFFSLGGGDLDCCLIA